MFVLVNIYYLEFISMNVMFTACNWEKLLSKSQAVCSQRWLICFFLQRGNTIWDFAHRQHKKRKDDFAWVSFRLVCSTSRQQEIQRLTVFLMAVLIILSSFHSICGSRGRVFKVKTAPTLQLSFCVPRSVTALFVLVMWPLKGWFVKYFYSSGAFFWSTSSTGQSQQ